MNDEGGSWHAKGRVEIGKHDCQVNHLTSGVNESNYDTKIVNSELDGIQIASLHVDGVQGAGESNVGQ